MSRPDAVAAMAAERVTELRRQIDYLASTVALLPASPERAAAQAAVQADRPRRRRPTPEPRRRRYNGPTTDPLDEVAVLPER
jgi:hypothetical protein